MGKDVDETKFYHCEHCGNVVVVVSDGGAVPSCCGEPMALLEAKETGAGAERHVPVVGRDGEKLVVRVGEARHDMVAEHLIEWIALERAGRLCVTFLGPEEEPTAKFADCGCEGGTVYAYCNIHGLWKANVA